MSSPPAPVDRAPSDDPHHARRWLILAVIGIAQLMVVLDATIVNIALPSAQRDLGFSDDSRQWIVTAYALAFGSLLLLGGRIGDLFGRKRVFVTGLLGFAAVSALGGAAESFGLLVAARALQGVFGALLAPAALSLLTTTFSDPAERGKAFGIFGAIAGGGAAVGLLLGGVLTEYLSWRWCLYVNLAFAIPAALGALALLQARPQGHRPKLDIPGTVLGTAGLFSLVYGFSQAERTSWGDTLTIVFFVAAAVLLVGFVLVQQRVAAPLLPLRIVLDRNRAGSYVAMGLSGAAMFGVFLFLTYFLQRNLGLSPIRTGLAFLPMSFVIIASATLATTVLLPRFGPKPLILTGLTLGALGMAYFTLLDVDSGYAGGVLPGLLLLGLGLGQIFAPGFQTATVGVRPADAGVASAMVNTMQQVGGSIGTALLSTVFTQAINGGAQDAVAAGQNPKAPQIAAQISIDSYTTAFWWAAGLLALGLVINAFLLRWGRPEDLAADAGDRDGDEPGAPADAPPAREPVLAH